MAGEVSRGSPNVLRWTSPMAFVVGGVVAVTWYVAGTSSGFIMELLAVPSAIGPAALALFFALIVTMMVAMMLPSALPMILAYHGMTRLEAGRPTKPADALATALFVAPYFLVWGAFGVAALLGLVALGVVHPWDGAYVLVPALTLIGAGVYQMTRTKEACLSRCQSPVSFVMGYWRSGRVGALRMGLRHAMFCIGCCWLFMIVLFVAGAMSLVWMGALSIAIFVEKVGTRPLLTSRAIGALLIAVGVLVGLGPLLAS